MRAKMGLLGSGYVCAAGVRRCMRVDCLVAEIDISYLLQYFIAEPRSIFPALIYQPIGELVCHVLPPTPISTIIGFVLF